MRTLDVAVVLAYLAASAGIGLKAARRSRGMEGYFRAGRTIPWWAAGLSVIATETSAATFIGVPGAAYAATGNLTYLQLALGALLARVVIGAVFLPAFYRANAFTVYDFVDRRFGPRSRTATAALFVVGRTLGDGVRLLIAAVAVRYAWPAIPLEAAILAMGAVTVLYTVLGGIRAVVWTDVMQGFVFALGAVAALAWAVDRTPGGLDGVLAYARERGKLRLFDLSTDGSAVFTLWTALFGASFLGLASHGTDQDMAQRLLTCPDARTSRRGILFSAALLFPTVGIFLAIGIALAATYALAPPAYALPEKGDFVFPTFIGRELPAGVAGLVIAAVLAAAMSTLSSALQSLTSATVVNLVRPFSRRVASLDDEAQVRFSKRVAVGFSLLVVGAALALVPVYQGDPKATLLELALSVFGYTYGAMLGVFLLGFLTGRGEDRWNLHAIAFGIAAVVAVKHGTSLAWPWYYPIGTAATFLVGLIPRGPGGGTARGL
ncbi:MAG TPA: sodium/solute symporter [Planctomycetota bacterium]|jgi:SSS family transporter|nr:sodium/solute symporter [Planctomycetota bacterium]